VSADRCFLEERQGVAVAVASAAATEVDDLSFASESATLILGVRYVALPMQMRWSEAGGLASAQDDLGEPADGHRGAAPRVVEIVRSSGWRLLEPS